MMVRSDGAQEGAAEAEAGVDSGRGSLDQILGLHIRLAHGAVYRHFTESFAHLELTQKQVSVLWLVQEHPGIAQTDLAQRLQMDRATVMAIVNRLQARGLISRGKSHDDGRRQTLHLSAAGTTTLEQSKTAILQHEQWLKSRFTQKEVEQLTDLLSRIHG
jgi:DNA-binding MarR family transcriptional regulator